MMYEHEVEDNSLVQPETVNAPSKKYSSKASIKTVQEKMEWSTVVQIKMCERQSLFPLEDYCPGSEENPIQLRSAGRCAENPFHLNLNCLLERRNLDAISNAKSSFFFYPQAILS